MIKILLFCILSPFALMAQAVVAENTPCTAYNFPAVSPLVFRLPNQNGISPNNWTTAICGGNSEDNPAWWKFKPPGNSVTITIEMYSCSNINGSQIIIWKENSNNCNNLTAVDCYFPYAWNNTPPLAYSLTTPYIWTITTVPNAQYYIQFDGTNETQCSFTVSFNAATLPIELLDFEAEVEQKQIFLHWQTASEQNNASFDIERSNNGTHFEGIGNQIGNGTTNKLHHYYFTDKKPLSGINYYRLKQNDVDGNFKYSKIISKNINTENSFVVSPNPTDDKLSIQCNTSKEGTLTLSNAQGQAVLSRKLLDKQDFIEISLLEFPKGIYFLQLEENGKKSIERIVKY